MMNILVRRSSSTLLKFRPLAAAVFSSLECLAPRTSASVGVGRTISGDAADGIPGFGFRRFYSGSRVLEFRASDVLRAQAVALDELSAAKAEKGLDIAKLGISEEIVGALARKGITKLFPIQRAVLEPAIQGRDMIGRAKTGTGKTLAFGIPIMDKIIQYNAKHGRGRNPLSIVLAPTRELAKQVEKEFHDSAPNLDTLCVYGGTPISQQMRQLDYGVDIVVGTPGRVIDLLKRGALVLSEVQFVVLDEADQMLNVGFAEDVEVILEKLPQRRQTLMFSATMPSWIRKLTQKYLTDPVVIDLVGEDDQKLAEGISLYSIASDMYGRASILGPLITDHAKGGKCIVFTGTKRDADRLAYAMGRSYKCEALHGDISQNQRERTLSGFRDGTFNILFATDVAARGLDIPNVDLVIHYDLPNTSEIFVHRSGRTGRAGKKGTAILIHSEQQSRDVKGIERDIGSRFTQLPRIVAEGGDILRDMGGGFGRPGGYNGFGSRSSGFGSSGGRSGGSFSGRTAGSSRFGSFGGNSSGQSGGGFGRSNADRFGSSGGSGFSRGGGFGDIGSSDRSRGDFGSPNRSASGFGDFGSPSRSGGGFGDSSSRRSSRFGDFDDDNPRSGRRSF
uniref:Uncharacterized protein n=1 Tax=Kalanchoe fedtschenkoi TaxID=63787 RepID=A0A7N0RJD4_KALFE